MQRNGLQAYEAAVREEILSSTPLIPNVISLVEDYCKDPKEYIAILFARMEADLKNAGTDNEKSIIKNKTARVIADYCLALLEEQEQNGVAIALSELSYENVKLLQQEWVKLATPMSLLSDQSEQKNPSSLYEISLSIKSNPQLRSDHQARKYYLLYAYYYSLAWWAPGDPIESTILSKELEITLTDENSSKLFPKSLLHALKVKWYTQNSNEVLALMRESSLHLDLRYFEFAKGYGRRYYQDNLKGINLSKTNLQRALLPPDLRNLQLDGADLTNARSDFVKKIVLEGKDEDIDFLANAPGGIDMWMYDWRQEKNNFLTLVNNAFFGDAYFSLARHGRLTALQYAASKGHIPLLRKLIEKGADINKEEYIYKRLAFKYAFVEDQFAAFKFLVLHEKAKITQDDIKWMKEWRSDAYKRYSHSLLFGIMGVGILVLSYIDFTAPSMIAILAGLTAAKTISLIVAGILVYGLVLLMISGAIACTASLCQYAFQKKEFNEILDKLDEKIKKSTPVPEEKSELKSDSTSQPAPNNEMKRSPASPIKLHQQSFLAIDKLPDSTPTHELEESKGVSLSNNP